MQRLNRSARFISFASVIVVIAASLVSWSASADTRLALIIGNGAYPAGPLSSPENDGQAVTDKLRGLGFAVTEKLNLNRVQLLNAIRDFGDQLIQHPGAVGLFYYSGHGMSVNNRNYIIPVDASIHSEPDVELYAVPVDNVLVRMAAAQDKANIIILDACRDNPFEKRWKSSNGGLAPINDEPSGTLIAYAAAPGHVAEAGLQGRLSKYTEALVALIGQPDENLITTFQDIQNAVYRSTDGRQQPYLEISPGLPYFSLNVRLPSNPIKTGRAAAPFNSEDGAEPGAVRALTVSELLAQAKKMRYHDWVEAARLYKLAADQGDSTAQTELAYLYFSGWGVAKDYGEAARLSKLAADQGDSTAQTQLAELYHSGLGVPKDDGEAVRLYKLAADQGNSRAQVALGAYYASGGWGLPKDDREAARLYKLAADQGDKVAAERLGELYEDGRGGLPKNDRQAAMYYDRSGIVGHDRLQNLIKKYGMEWMDNICPSSYCKANR
jgi:hypothetical protein